MCPYPCGRMAFVGTRWRESGVPRAGDYDARWDSLAAQGQHGAGFQMRAGRVSVEEYGRFATAAGFEPVARWATWDREPFAGGNYVVSVHRLASSTRLVGGAAQ